MTISISISPNDLATLKASLREYRTFMQELTSDLEAFGQLDKNNERHIVENKAIILNLTTSLNAIERES